MATKINSERLKSTLVSLKARFETGTITSMDDLTDMYITGLITILGMGYDSFINKCTSPEKFVVEDLVKMSQVFDVDINLIMKVVLSQATKNVKPKDVSRFLTSK
ncbi:hypothetical protein [Pedobacter helvus]|uniref:Phage protein n=1 Tax=Pedobacter helvus TaxID=2563444 RepID=A0ABW9JMI4_9SPHI|nr:hypothetical protein [Pedobacter ureilyticus]